MVLLSQGMDREHLNVVKSWQCLFAAGEKKESRYDTF